MTSYSPVLAINEIAENQTNKYVTHNNAVSFLEAAANKRLVKSSGVGTSWTILESEFTRYFTFKPSGSSGNFKVICPAATNVSVLERVFCVHNADTTNTATVQVGDPGPAGTTVSVPPGYIAVCYRNGNDIIQLTLLITSLAYDLGFFVAGLPGASATVMIWKAVRAFTLADDFAGSQCKVGVNPTATAVFDVQKNESSIGSISINTSGVATFSTTGGSVSMAIGDRLKVVAPTSQDATMSDVGVAFLGSRSP